MNQVQFSTRKYEASHGCKPRGFGGWGFIVMDASESPHREHETFFVPASTFAEARVAAKRVVAERFAAEFESGYAYLEVAP